MVRVHHGNKEAFLRFVEGGVSPSIYVCGKSGLPIARDHIGSVHDAYDWLARHWRIPTMLSYQSDEDGDYEQVHGSERIFSDEKKVGDLTLEQEVDWLMFHLGRIVYNLTDGQLWKIGCKSNRVGGLLPVVPFHRPIHLSQWSVPQFPDRHYVAFESELTRAHPSVLVQTKAAPGHFKVARLVAGTCLRKFPVVAIKRDVSSGLHRVVSLLGEEREHVFFHSDEDGAEGSWSIIHDLTKKHQDASWEELFPEGFDVVAMSKREFYQYTFAGHCYQTDNFVGIPCIPTGYVIAWENRYDDIVLLRKRVNVSEIRCPPDLKGKVIGAHGGNIKRIAKELGREHWQIRLV